MSAILEAELIATPTEPSEIVRVDVMVKNEERKRLSSSKVTDLI